MKQTRIERQIMLLITHRQDKLNSFHTMTDDRKNECQLIDDLIDAIKMVCDNRDKIIERMKKS